MCSRFRDGNGVNLHSPRDVCTQHICQAPFGHVLFNDNEFSKTSKRSKETAETGVDQ